VADFVDTYILRVTLVSLSARKVSNVPDSPKNNDWMVSLTALGLSNCLGPPGYLDRSTIDLKQIMQ